MSAFPISRDYMTASLAARTVLLVDDHVVFRQSLAWLLRQRYTHWSFLEAGSLHNALKVLASGARIDLLLLDLTLKDSRGQITLERLRAAHPGVPLLVLSGDEREEQVAAARDRGAAGYVFKTADVQALQFAVECALRGVPSFPAGPAASVDEPEGAEGANGELLLECEPVTHWGEPVPGGFSGRQADVIRLLLDGKSNKLISRELAVSESTVKTHLQAIFRKLDVNSRTQAVVAAARLGFPAG